MSKNFLIEFIDYYGMIVPDSVEKFLENTEMFSCKTCEYYLISDFKCKRNCNFFSKINIIIVKMEIWKS